MAIRIHFKNRAIEISGYNHSYEKNIVSTPNLKDPQYCIQIIFLQVTLIPSMCLEKQIFLNSALNTGVQSLQQQQQK